MLRRQYEADWERRKGYLIRAMFAEIPALSPIPESRESRSVSPFGDVGPLPELITERVPKRRHDEPDEYYDRLQKRMRKYYRKIFNKPDGDSSGTDFDETVYDQFNPECTEISYDNLNYDTIDLNAAIVADDSNLQDVYRITDEYQIMLDTATCPDHYYAEKPTQISSSESPESIKSGKEVEKARSSSSTVKEQIEHVVVRAMVHREDIRDSYVFPVKNPDVMDKDTFALNLSKDLSVQDMDISETATVVLDVINAEKPMSSTMPLYSQSGHDRDVGISIVQEAETKMTQGAEKNKTVSSEYMETILLSSGTSDQSSEPKELDICNQEKSAVENTKENISTDYDITPADVEVDTNEKQTDEVVADLSSVSDDEEERENVVRCRETEATENESFSNHSELKAQGSEKTDETHDSNVVSGEGDIEEEIQEEIEEDEEEQETEESSVQENEDSGKEKLKESKEILEDKDNNNDIESERVTRSLIRRSEEKTAKNVEIIVTEIQKETGDEPMDEIEIMRSHEPSPSLGSLQHEPTDTTSSGEIERGIEHQHSVERDILESNIASASEEFSQAGDASDDLHPLLRTSTPTQETRRTLKRCSSDPITDEYSKRQRFRELVTQITKDLKRKRHVEVQTDEFKHRNVETQTEDVRERRGERPQTDEQTNGIHIGCQTEPDEDEREGNRANDSDGSGSETQENTRNGTKRRVYELYLTGENFYMFF